MAKQEYNLELNKIRSILVGSTKGFTVTEISRRIGTNRNSIAKYLDILVTSGTVEMKTVGSAKLFTLSKRMPIASIINFSSDLILILDEDFNVSFANANMLAFEKKSLDEITGKNVKSLELSKDGDAEIRKLLDDSMGGQELSADLELVTGADPVAYHAKFIPGILENTRKGLIVLLSAARENGQMTGNQQGEMGGAATATGRETRTPASGLPGVGGGKIFPDYIHLLKQGIWAVDEKARTTFINRSMAGMLGYSVGEMIGQPFYKFVDEREKEFAAATFAVLEKDRNARQEIDLRFTRKDGPKIGSTVDLTPFFGDSGKFTGALAIVTGIPGNGMEGGTSGRTEEDFRTIIETLPSGVVIFDTPGTIRMANRQTGKFLGFPAAKELDGMNIFNFISPNSTEKCQESLKKVAGNRDFASFECRFIRKDSTGFCGDMMVSLLRGDTEEKDFFVGIITDITERRKADALLRQSESKYRSLVEGLSYSIFTADTFGKITYISPAIEQILGYLPEELAEKHFYALVSPDTRHELGVKLKESTSGISTPFDCQVTDKSGNLRWVRIIAQPLKEGNTVSGINGLIGDINDWKLAENAFNECSAKYKTVMEDQTDLICRLAPDLHLRFVNPAFCRFFDKTEDGLLGENLGDLLPGPAREALVATLGNITREVPIKPFEMDLTSSSGIPLSYHVTARAIFSRQGEKTEYQVCCRDITEMKSYFERSQKLLQQLQVHETAMSERAGELKRVQAVAEFSEQKNREFFESIPVGSFILDEAGKILEINGAAADLIGKPRSSLIAGALATFVAGKSIPAYTGFLGEIFSARGKGTCEVTLVRDGSTPFTAHLIGKVIPALPDTPRRCSTVIIDSNEVKKEGKHEPGIVSPASRRIPRAGISRTE